MKNELKLKNRPNNLTNHIASAGFGVIIPDIPQQFLKEDIKTMYEQLMKTADRKDGGFGQAPKFPQTFSIRFLLQHYFYTGTTGST